MCQSGLVYHRRLSEEVEAALSALDAVDAAVAADARVVWSDLLDHSARNWPTQASVQHYCWRVLREQYASADRRWELALVLGRLLDRLGQLRYAGIARGEVTRSLLYAESSSRWWSLYREALDQAGVQPADTDLVTWYEHPRPNEMRIAQRVADTLEVVAVVGDLSINGLSRLSPKTRRRRMTDAVLVTEDSVGCALIERIVGERLAQWSGESTARARLVGGLGPVVRTGDQPPAEAVRRIRGLLEVIGDGVDLTDGGCLRGSVVAEVLDRVWPGQFDPPAPTESSFEQVATLRRLVMRLRLVRKYRGRLIPTARGKGLTDDALARLLVAELVRDDGGIGAAVGDVVFGRIARDGAAGEEWGIAGAARDLFRSGQLRADGVRAVEPDPADPDLDDGDCRAELPTVHALMAELIALGAVDDAGQATGGQATGDGRTLAAAVVRHRLLHADIGG